MEITRISTDRISVRINGEECLGVRTGVPARGFAAQRVSAAARMGATLVRGDRFEPWPIRRVVERDGEFYICGPMVKGRTIGELLDAAPLAGSGWLPLLLGAVARASRHDDMALCNITTSLVGEDGAVLCLNRDLAVQINANMPLDERKTAHFPYRMERPTDGETEVYQALAITYHALAGVPVCREENAEASAQCHGASLEKAPLHVHRPEIRSDLATMVEDGLRRHEARTPELLEQIAAVVHEHGIVESLTAAEAQERKATADAMLERNRSNNQRKTFWRKHGRTLLLAGLATALVLTVPISILRNKLQPPATAGMGPRAVAETYYTAWNDLDHMLMEDTLARGVGRDTVREVTNVYVIDRVQTAQTWESTLMPATDWLAAGQPDGRMPYGIHNLELRLMSQGTEEATVRTEYEIWRPETVEEPDGTSRSVAIRTQASDLLTLIPTDHAWEISSIRTTVRGLETIPINLQQTN